MPNRPVRICYKPGCGKLTKNVYCDSHINAAKKEYEKGRKTAHQRGYDSRWRKAAKEFIKANPLCVICLDKGRTQPSNEVDHIIPHKGDTSKFWDMSNWQALCKPCHSEKTVKEDGRWD